MTSIGISRASASLVPCWTPSGASIDLAAPSTLTGDDKTHTPCSRVCTEHRVTCEAQGADHLDPCAQAAGADEDGIYSCVEGFGPSCSAARGTGCCAPRPVRSPLYPPLEDPPMCEGEWYTQFLDLNPAAAKRRQLTVDCAQAQAGDVSGVLPPARAPLLARTRPPARRHRGPSLGLTSDQDIRIIANMPKAVLPAFRAPSEYGLPHDTTSMKFPPR